METALVGEKSFEDIVKSLSEVKKGYLALISHGVSLEDATQIIGRHKLTVWDWRNHDEGFEWAEKEILENKEKYQTILSSHINAMIMAGLVKIAVKIENFNDLDSRQRADVKWAVAVYMKLHPQKEKEGSYEEFIHKARREL